MYAVYKWGSPPHTWRIRLVICSSLSFIGITSTYVENTEKLRCDQVNTRDHLHIRGEYPITLKLPSIIWGSPPHTWRILVPDGMQTHNNRITSTCVENTATRADYWQRSKDHLHMCGEYCWFFQHLQSKKGSPPHVWRILWVGVFDQSLGRITSTCVENTHK